MEDRDPVGELLGLIEVLRGEQDRGAAVGELADGLPHLQASVRVEASGRLVEEDHRRASDQAHRDVETAAHAARVGGHPPPPGVVEREAGEQVVGDSARLVEVPQLGDQHQVLPSGEDVVNGGELPGEADRAPDVGGLRDDVEAVHHGRAAIGPEKRREDLDEGGLAGPVGAEKGEDAARRHVQVDAAKHLEVAVGLHEPSDPDG